MKALITLICVVLVAIAVGVFIIAGNTNKSTDAPPEQPLWQWCQSQPGGC